MLIQTEAPLFQAAGSLNLETKKKKTNLKEYKKTQIQRKKNNSKELSMAMLQRIKNTKNT